MIDHKKCRDEENYLKSKLNELKVRSVSELIMQSEAIHNFMYLDMLEWEIKDCEDTIKKSIDQEDIEITQSLLKHYKRDYDKFIKWKDITEIYKRATHAYFNNCKFLFD